MDGVNAMSWVAWAIADEYSVEMVCYVVMSQSILPHLYFRDRRLQNTHRLSPRGNQTGNKSQSSLWRFRSQHSSFIAEECGPRELVRQQVNPNGLSGIGTSEVIENPEHL